MTFKTILLILVLLCSLSAAQWEVTGEMPVPVCGGQAIVMDSLIYIFGGYSDSLRGPVNIVQAFNPRTRIWHKAGYMRVPRYGFVADKVDDSLVIYCGGIRSNSRESNSLETWNPNTFGPDAAQVTDYNNNFNRIFLSGHVYNGFLYLFGGMSSTALSDTSRVPYIVRYDLKSDSISFLREDLYQDNELPYHHMTVRVDSLVYILGGTRLGVLNQVRVFNLNSFDMKDTIRMRAVRAGGSAVYHNGNIYVIGGYSESTIAIRATDILNITTDSAEMGPGLNYDRRELMAVNYYDTAIYVFGGKDQDGRVVPYVEQLDLITTISFRDETPSVPGGFVLKENYPDPFNATTVIEFEIHQPGHIRLEVYALDGSHIKTLADGYQTAGAYRYTWLGDDRNGIPVSSGVYIYRLINGSNMSAKKMALIR